MNMEKLIVSSDVLSQYLPVGTEKNHENLSQGRPYLIRGLNPRPPE